VVEIHYYRNRALDSTAFHKDTVGQTLFVNLNYLNEEEIAGAEYILNPRKEPTHEQQIKASWPARARRDLLKVRKQLPPNPTEIKWAGNIGAYGVLAFTDETLHHATPVTRHREVYSADLKKYLEETHPNEYQLAEQLYGDFKADLSLPYIGHNAQPILKPLYDMANVPITPAQYYTRTNLRAANMPSDWIDALLDRFGKRGQVGIQGKRSDILDPMGNTKTLHRKISQISLNDPSFPRQSKDPRSFFRTWVRTIRA